MGSRILVAILILVILGLLLSGVALFSFFAGGSSADRSATRDVSDFTAVNFSYYGDMTIVQGEREGLTIDTDEDLLARIETTVRNGTLTIESDNRFGFWSGFRFLRPPQAIRYTLYVRTLEELDLSGAGLVYAEQLIADRLTLNDSGAGTITIDRLTADDLKVTISGAGAIELAGQVTSQDVTMSGLGGYNADDLESQDTQVDLSGAGSVTVWVREQLDANISGAGSIRYYGSPEVNSSISGLGGVDSLGAK